MKMKMKKFLCYIFGHDDGAELGLAFPVFTHCRRCGVRVNEFPWKSSK